MASRNSRSPIFILDRLQGLACLFGGIVLSTLVVVGLSRGEMYSRWGAVRWADNPWLFTLGVVVLSAAAIWLVRRSYVILTQQTSARPRHEP